MPRSQGRGLLNGVNKPCWFFSIGCGYISGNYFHADHAPLFACSYFPVSRKTGFYEQLSIGYSGVAPIGP